MLSISQSRPEPEPLKGRKMVDSSSVDSGQDTLSASGESEIYFSSGSSSSTTSETVRGAGKIMHSYIASRGQRERETDIYEVNPPPPLLSCHI